MGRRDSLSSFSGADSSDLSSASNDEDKGDIEGFTDPTVNETNFLQRHESSTGSVSAAIPTSAPSPVARSLSSRLAFWEPRGKKPNPVPPEIGPFPDEDHPANLTSENPGSEVPQSPTRVTYADSVTQDESMIEKSTRLEHRIISQCVKFFSHEMFFSYDFG